ncbi:type IV pilus assembly protein PilB [Halanaerobium saccharolyticum]|uniref:Type IV pilus assembly protein PilB n=1 Tax=Halanaerobium saccharolyticum TaxID=43595 RepID=A0A4R7YU57_9FIRM|nr:GspE/PulE family protein [Halanaerobium saccharolyticum]RAK06707.1 type IV pilus assembly protein PilB [Halanaerobium saccharolyticum]TDW01344.1 type IV pilus assembly protein PilB [Halanaerobium saccharolyticum]TDX52812.1 type IV pilus assembly protein PilB [Halanaerobium saccharolyticum]
MTAKNRKKLGELLVDHEYISREQLQEALDRSKNSDKKLGEILVDLGYVKEEDLIEVLEFQRGIPHADLDKYFFDPSLAELIPENIARRYLAVPIEKNNQGKLKVVMADPTDLIAIDDIEMLSNLSVDPLYGAPRQIRSAIDRLYGNDDIDISNIFEDFNLEGIKDVSDNQNEQIYEEEELREMVDEAPIIKLANYIISKAYQKGASDIHIEPEDDKIRVRFRIDGVLKKEMTAPKSSHRALVSRIKIIANLDITEQRVPQDGRIKMIFKGEKLDMRVSTLPTIKGEKIVIRLLAQNTNLLDLDNLGLTDYNRKKLGELIKKPNGVLLLTGPTGSGKSTTLFAALNELNSPQINMVTIEDPVEYQIAGINQVQAKEKSGLTFAKTLRSILRQDPDIIMIGEMRDQETAEIAVRSALTGHLVFSTLHTNDAVSSITRLTDIGLAPYLVAASLNGVVAQRLVRRLCPYCKEKRKLETTELKFLDNPDFEVAYFAVGCEKCNNTGYDGRLAIQEIFEVDSQVKEMISNNLSREKISEYAKNKGMITLKEDGIVKIKAGETDVSELERIIY